MKANFIDAMHARCSLVSLLVSLLFILEDLCTGDTRHTQVTNFSVERISSLASEVIGSNNSFFFNNFFIDNTSRHIKHKLKMMRFCLKLLATRTLQQYTEPVTTVNSFDIESNFLNKTLKHMMSF